MRYKKKVMNLFLVSFCMGLVFTLARTIQFISNIISLLSACMCYFSMSKGMKKAYDRLSLRVLRNASYGM